MIKRPVNRDTLLDYLINAYNENAFKAGVFRSRKGGDDRMYQNYAFCACEVSDILEYFFVWGRDYKSRLTEGVSGGEKFQYYKMERVCYEGV